MLAVRDPESRNLEPNHGVLIFLQRDRESIGGRRTDDNNAIHTYDHPEIITNYQKFTATLLRFTKNN